MCGGTGDLLKGRRVNWNRGWPGWVHVESVSELVTDRGTDEYGYRYTDPTPLLTALTATPPWGMPLRGVIVDELKPSRGGRYGWNRNQLPDPVYDLLKPPYDLDFPYMHPNWHEAVWWYPSEQAAIRAKAAAFLEFGRNGK